MPHPMCERYLGAVDPPREDAPSAALEDILLRLVTEAHAAWPTVQLRDTSFLAHLAERTPQDVDLFEWLPTVHASDLYLACACAHGEATAIEAFTNDFGQLLERAASRIRSGGVQTEDVKQQLLEKLLFERGERPPAIALYAGQGALKGYLRVAAVHQGLKILDKYKRMPPVDDLDEVFSMAATDDDPELATLKSRYRGEFKAAFQEAIAALESADRNLLRYHYLSGLNTRQIGAIFGCDQSTIVRKLTKTRTGLLHDTRKRLSRALGVGNTEFESILKLVESQLEVSIERVLADSTEG
jgi:RNA polymerase sigma-70 factor (ECF subfamily)